MGNFKNIKVAIVMTGVDPTLEGWAKYDPKLMKDGWVTWVCFDYDKDGDETIEEVYKNKWGFVLHPEENRFGINFNPKYFKFLGKWDYEIHGDVTFEEIEI